MKFYTWKLKCENGEFTDPTYFVNDDIARVEPLFAIDDLIYVVGKRGELDVSKLSSWNVVEITEQDFLNAALSVNPNARIENNDIIMPISDEIV